MANDDSLEEDGEKDDLTAWDGGEGEKVISNPETESVTQTDYTEKNSSRDTREEETGENHLDNHHAAGESKTDHDDHETIREKYQALVAHNTRLIDILRSTLEMQADLFRRMIRYLFP